MTHTLVLLANEFHSLVTDKVFFTDSFLESILICFILFLILFIYFIADCCRPMSLWMWSTFGMNSNFSFSCIENRMGLMDVNGTWFESGGRDKFLEFKNNRKPMNITVVPNQIPKCKENCVNFVCHHKIASNQTTISLHFRSSVRAYCLLCAWYSHFKLTAETVLHTIHRSFFLHLLLGNNAQMCRKYINYVDLHFVQFFFFHRWSVHSLHTFKYVWINTLLLHIIRIYSNQNQPFRCDEEKKQSVYK